jgi:hypothetical protein
MNDSPSILRWVEESADALARLDTVVGGAPAGVGSLLMLRTAHEIASRAGERRLGGGEFAALLGWWHAAESREYVSLDEELRSIALGLDGAVERVRGGRALTPLLLAEIDGEGQGVERSPAMSSTLQKASDEKWPALMLAAALCSGECGADAGVAAAIIRAVAPMAGGLTTDALIAPEVADSPADALHRMATSARGVLLELRDYLRASEENKERAGSFGRGAPTIRALIDLLVGAPAVTVLGASAALGVSVPSTGAAVERLHGAGVLREITGRGRDRVFVYEPAIALAG